MKTVPILNSFSSGELSPLVYGRSDLAVYRSGLEKMLNMFPDSRGACISRTGNKYIETFASNEGRVFTLPVSPAFFYSLVFTDLGLQVTSITGLNALGGALAFPVIATVYAEADLEDIQFVISTQGDEIYFLHEKHAPHKITYDPIADTVAWSSVSFTSAPAEWAASSFPSTGSFFQGRLWLGGTVNDPQTFWASKSGLYEDFTQGALDDDALQFTIAKYGRIEWIAGFKNLLIGTANGEHIVSSAGGVITPSDINIEQQSSYGSASIQPVQVGDQVFYISADKKKVRAIQYQWQESNWLSKDLTFYSEHITMGLIKNIAWHQNPDDLFHCVLENGDIASMTYNRSNNSYGWCLLQFQGEIKDVSIGVINGVDYIFSLNKYDTNKLNLETQDINGDIKYLDSWISQPISSGVVSGLGHLEGLTCRVLVDGAIHPDRTVVAGEVSLQNDGVEATVGLPYLRKIKTLRVEGGKNEDSTSAHVKRFNKIFVRVVASSRPIINGLRPATRSPVTPMDEAEPLVTQNVSATSLGHDLDASITIEEDLPVALTIIGLFGELEQSLR